MTYTIITHYTPTTLYLIAYCRETGHVFDYDFIDTTEDETEEQYVHLLMMKNRLHRHAKNTGYRNSDEQEPATTPRTRFKISIAGTGNHIHAFALDTIERRCIAIRQLHVDGTTIAKLRSHLLDDIIDDMQRKRENTHLPF